MGDVYIEVWGNVYIEVWGNVYIEVKYGGMCTYSRSMGECVCTLAAALYFEQSSCDELMEFKHIEVWGNVYIEVWGNVYIEVWGNVYIAVWGMCT